MVFFPFPLLYQLELQTSIAGKRLFCVYAEDTPKPQVHWINDQSTLITNATGMLEIFTANQAAIVNHMIAQLAVVTYSANTISDITINNFVNSVSVTFDSPATRTVYITFLLVDKRFDFINDKPSFVVETAATELVLTRSLPNWPLNVDVSQLFRNAGYNWKLANTFGVLIEKIDY